LFASLAEFERDLIRERTHRGLASARARGKLGGRKRKLTDEQVKLIKAMAADPQVSFASGASEAIATSQIPEREQMYETSCDFDRH
jgi:DNA invertase Pin-like site-specific DNA recombinase